MKKDSGFTVIEMLIVLAIVGIILAVIFGEKPAPRVDLGARQAEYDRDQAAKTKIECVNGLQFVIEDNGNSKQVISEGRGVRC